MLQRPVIRLHAGGITKELARRRDQRRHRIERGDRLQPRRHRRDRDEGIRQEGQREQPDEAGGVGGLRIRHVQADPRTDPRNRVREEQQQDVRPQCVEDTPADTPADDQAGDRQHDEHEDLPGGICEGATEENRGRRHRQRTEAIDDALVKVFGKTHGAGRCRECHCLAEDAGHQVVAVGLGARVTGDRNGSAKDVGEQQHEDHRLDEREEQQLRHSHGLDEVAASDDKAVVDRPAPQGTPASYGCAHGQGCHLISSGSSVRGQALMRLPSLPQPHDR